MKKIFTEKRNVIRLGLSGALPLSAYAAQVIAHQNPQFIETWYARAAYPAIARAISFFTRLIPFSIAEFIVWLVGALVIYWLSSRIRQLIQRRRSPSVLFTHDAPNALIALGVAAHLFLLTWGYNYARPSVASNFQISASVANAERLESISREFIQRANACYVEAGAHPADSKGSALTLSRQALYEALDTTYRTQPQLSYIRYGAFAPPKPVIASLLMSHANIGGVFAPFTNEPNFNAQQPDCEIPFTIAHEMAHQRGFAYENEANFIAFLICISAPDPYIRYSGYFMASRYFLSDLNPDAERYRRVRSLIAEGPRRDWEALYNFWSQYQGQTSRISQKVNDAYLKANHVHSGVANYSEMTGLIIGYLESNTLPAQDEPNHSQ